MTATDPGTLIASLYARAQSATQAPPARPETQGPGPDAAPGAGQEGLAARAAEFVDTLRESERTALKGLAGRAEPQSVVMALAATELAVETAVTVRDRVVEAYQEILRMPV
jgi:flagellar hook-basal body complex protein FliE